LAELGETPVPPSTLSEQELDELLGVNKAELDAEMDQVLAELGEAPIPPSTLSEQELDELLGEGRQNAAEVLPNRMRPRPPAPAILRKRKGGPLPRIVPQNGPANRGVAERMNDDVDRPVRPRSRPAMVNPAAAMRDAIDQADVAEFLRALHALAQLPQSERPGRYAAISRTVERRPPQTSSVGRLSALMDAIDRNLPLAGPARERFRQIWVGWSVLQNLAPGLKVAPGSSVVRADVEAAMAFLADPAAMSSEPQRNRTNPITN
jgi:hypothetical protein